MAVGVVDEMTGTVLNTCPPCSKKPEMVTFNSIMKNLGIILEILMIVPNAYLGSEIV